MPEVDFWEMDNMPGNNYWLHTAFFFLLLSILSYFGGFLVKEKRVKVNYTRKLNHFAIFFLPQLLMNFIPYLRTDLTTVLNGFLTLLFLCIYIEPIRRNSAAIKTMFLSFDRPEDRPYTMLWLMTQFLGCYLVLIPISLYLIKLNAIELIYIPILINGIGDGLAEPVGIRFGKRFYCTRALFTKRKYTRSLEGSACVFVTSVFVVWGIGFRLTDIQFFAALIAIPVLMTLAEALSPHTWDSPIMYLTGGVTIITIVKFI